MNVMSVTFETSQPPMARSKSSVNSNIELMSVTFETSQAPMSWSNDHV
jgi:hypothetical protein